MGYVYSQDPAASLPSCIISCILSVLDHQYLDMAPSVWPEFVKRVRLCEESIFPQMKSRCWFLAFLQSCFNSLKRVEDLLWLN